MNTDPRDWARQASEAREEERAKPFHRPVLVVTSERADQLRAAGYPESGFVVDDIGGAR